MVDLESPAPVYYWTYDARIGIEAEDAQIWFEDPLRGNPVITEARIAFDYPESGVFGSATARYRWSESDAVVDMRLGPDGFYHWQSATEYYSGVRADTPTHTIITGRWRQDGIGKGVFIAVLPRAK